MQGDGHFAAPGRVRSIGPCGPWDKLTSKDKGKKHPLAGSASGRPGAGLPFFSGEAGQGQGQQESTLKQFGTNLTDQARAGKLDPVIGREKEISRMMEILSRRTKNNPLILGDPGVGRPPSSRGWHRRSPPATCRRTS